MKILAALILSQCLVSCTIHIHLHETPNPPAVASAEHDASDTVKGVVRDADGFGVSARIALVGSSGGGSNSTTTGAEGRFALPSMGSGEFTLHASTEDGRVAVARSHEGAGEFEMILQRGATLTIELVGQEHARCAVFSDDRRIEDFTLHSDRPVTIVVPAGDQKVEIYDGDTVLQERGYHANAGGQGHDPHVDEVVTHGGFHTLNFTGFGPGLRRTSAIILAATFQTGCVGVIYHGTQQGELKSPSCASVPGRLQPSGPYTWNLIATSDAVRHAWGSPDEVEPRSNGIERWSYYGGLRWSGVVLCAIVLPIPLFVPVGRDRVSIDFRDGVAVSAEAVVSEELWHLIVGFYGHSGFVAEFERGVQSGLPEVDLRRRGTDARD